MGKIKKKEDIWKEKGPDSRRNAASAQPSFREQCKHMWKYQFFVTSSTRTSEVKWSEELKVPQHLSAQPVVWISAGMAICTSAPTVSPPPFCKTHDTAWLFVQNRLSIQGHKLWQFDHHLSLLEQSQRDSRCTYKAWYSLNNKWLNSFPVSVHLFSLVFLISLPQSFRWSAAITPF